MSIDNKNEKRADWAEESIREFACRRQETPLDIEEGITDFLCNLHHLCDRYELDFNDLLQRARGYYTEEITVDGPKLGPGRQGMPDDLFKKRLNKATNDWKKIKFREDMLRFGLDLIEAYKQGTYTGPAVKVDDPFGAISVRANTSLSLMQIVTKEGFVLYPD
jgi:hypothetical protein